MTPDDMETRTPAPEGEAVAWMDRDVAWDVISDVHKKRWSEINGPEVTQRYSRPLYASPVVPVGVSREEIARAVKSIERATRNNDGSPIPEDYGEVFVSVSVLHTILAALRPTDTGRE
jgi:hypothetical protein